MATHEQDATLPGLPVELLHRVVDYLPVMSVLPLRLTCKTLQRGTLDRFATFYFEERRFCILIEAQWNLLWELLSSRFASRLRRIIFTTQVFTPEQLGFRIHKHKNEMGMGEFDASQAYKVIMSDMMAPAMITEPPSSNQMTRVLQGIKEKAQNARTELDLGDTDCKGIGDVGMCDLLDNGVQNMISAATASPGALNKLKLGVLFTAVFARLLSRNAQNLTSFVSTLSELIIVNTSRHDGEAEFGRSEDRLDAVGKLLESVDMLRALRLDFTVRASMGPWDWRLTMTK